MELRGATHTQAKSNLQKYSLVIRTPDLLIYKKDVPTCACTKFNQTKAYN